MSAQGKLGAGLVENRTWPATSCGSRQEARPIAEGASRGVAKSS